MSAVPLDPYLRTVGEQLEDLTQVVPASRYQFSGTDLSLEDLATFESARPHRRISGSSLVDAGLISEQGNLADGARAVHQALTAATGRLRLDSPFPDGATYLDARFYNGRAALIFTRRPDPAGSGRPSALNPERGGTVRLDWVDAAQVPAAMAAWVGLGPAWSLATNPVMLPEGVIDARRMDADIPFPADADAHLRYVWAQPWTPWTLRGTGSAFSLSMVDAGRAGSFQVSGSDRGLVAFHAMPSSLVWNALVDYAARASMGARSSTHL